MHCRILQIDRENSRECCRIILNPNRHPFGERIVQEYINLIRKYVRESVTRHGYSVDFGLGQPRRFLFLLLAIFVA